MRSGGNPDICVIYSYLYSLFEEDDNSVEEMYRACKDGERICGECKSQLADKVAAFLKEHQRRREAAEKKVDEFLLKE